MIHLHIWISQTHDRRMTANTNSRTGSVRYRSFAVVVKFGRHVGKMSASSDRRMPCAGIHGEVLEVYEIKNEFAILSAHAYYSQISLLTAIYIKLFRLLRIP